MTATATVDISNFCNLEEHDETRERLQVGFLAMKPVSADDGEAA